jgi:cytochrome b involved in lipid metabolism
MESKKNSQLPLIVGLVVALMLGGGLYYYNASKQMPAPSYEDAEAGMTDSGSPIPTDASEIYTIADVAMHNSGSSCWSIVDNNVYDLTTWIPEHPGGERAIEGMCGKDGTAVFHGQHDNAKRQADVLATFKIGTLAE